MKNIIDEHLLIHGDSIKILKKITNKYFDSIDLIYLDPPFGTNKSYFLYSEKIENNYNTIKKQLAYEDYWSETKFESFIKKLIQYSKILLSEKGFIVFQCDSNFNYLVRSILNKTFGKENFRGEILINVEARDLDTDIIVEEGKLKQSHNVLFIYSKTIYTKLPSLTTQKIIKRNSMWFPFATLNQNNNSYELLGVTPKGCYWKWEKNRALNAITNFNNFVNSSINLSFEKFARINPDKEFIKKEDDCIKYYYNNLTECSDTNSSYWFDISYRGYETVYPTEKNLALLKRILEWLSAPDSIVLDPFLGSGTTLIASEMLNRLCIGIDINEVSIITAKKRLETFRSKK